MERKLVLTFIDQMDAKVNFIINDVKQSPEVTEAEILAIMNAAINGSVVMSKNGLVKSIDSAMIVDTTETKYDLA